MISSANPSQNEIINLLSKLKNETPEYPSDLLAARKAAFIQQAIAIQFNGPKQGGKGGGDGGSSSLGGSGGSGALGGMSTAQGFLLQAVIGVWIIAGMLTAAYVFRDQIIDLLQDNGIVEVVTQAPFIDSPAPEMVEPAGESPLPEIPPTGGVAPSETPVPGTVSDENAVPEEASGDQAISENPEDTKNNPGLHLGQTPDAPNLPNEEKPDNPNKPDQPNKPDKKK